MEILAHRGYVDGPDPRLENRLPAMERCLARGWGLETDLRRAPNGRFYISHDPAPVANENDAVSFCALWRRHTAATIALNVKELGYEGALLDFLEENRVIDRVFLFDMELIEDWPGDAARRFRALHPSVRLAARASDRGEPIERALAIDVAAIIWLDEFDRLWVREDDVRRLKEAGRRIYAISPEIHGFGADDTRSRWRDFLAWGVDGLCTDYPAAVERFVRAAAAVGATS